jgi:hypothetical protein
MPDDLNTPAVVPHDTKLPPAPPGVRYVPVPLIGIVVATDARRDRVDRFFHWPMIVLALAILPLLVIELVQQPDGWLKRVLQVGFVVIWLAFLIEFVIKIAIAESRFEYVRRNWLDVVIILVPVIRPLRATRAVRTARIFKLRGVGMKLLRYVLSFVVGLEATERALERMGFRNRDRTDPRQMTRHELMDEVRRLRRRVDRWEEWHEAHEEHVAEYGGACLPRPKPSAQDPPESAPAPASDPT